jgi:two-component system sensor histidine kinase UhpB
LEPVSIFAIVLTATFTVEGAIMLLLPYLPAWSRTRLIQGVLDASLLTLIMAPVLWWLVVKPLRLLSESRGHLLHSLFHSQEQERSRIAHDLHDQIGQQLTALLVGLGTVESAKDLPTAQKLAHELRVIGVDTHDEVRRIVRGIRPGVLEELGLAAALERLCEEFEEIHGIEVRLTAPDAAVGTLPWTVQISLYRILQESLTNVAKHAQARSVDVALTRASDMVTLTIQDDGRGFHETGSAGSSGMGLNSIRERARMVHGTCAIRAADGRGLLIQVTIPAQE